MRNYLLVVVCGAWVLAMFANVACGDDPGSVGGSGGDADTDGDADGDGDSDSDADSDTDHYSDTDMDCPKEDSCGPAEECCQQGEECVNDWQCLPVCENARCGENLETCCAALEICLDGIDCAASCAAEETVCGENLDICCPSGDVCVYDECVTPGIPCDNNFDCLDEALYCEETIGECLPLPRSSLCEGTRNFTEIEATLEWWWPGVTYQGKYYINSMASPMVGDVDGDGTPEVVVVLYQSTAYTAPNLIAVLSGDTGELKFTIPGEQDPTAPMAWIASVALANFDSDPGLEIVYMAQGGAIRIADNDGVGDVCDKDLYPSCKGIRTSGTGTVHTYGGIAVADVDHDGMPDVISRCQVLNGHDISNPALDFVNAACGHQFNQTVVADLNEDGKPEVVDGQRAITIDPAVSGGIPLWTATGQGAGRLAVADLLPDIEGPEIVNVNSGFNLIEGLTGTVLIGAGGTLRSSAVPIPGGGRGGAPTVADFDGDGLPEVSSAGANNYVVFDPDCTEPLLRAGGTCASGATDMILWQSPTRDYSSNMTGSSVFDFQGDGIAEVIYNDECFLHIYDGLTGAELVNPVIPSPSHTLLEYPLVADVDGDGNSEMIVVSTDYYVSQCAAAWKDAGVTIDTICETSEKCTEHGPCGAGGTCGQGQCNKDNVCQSPGGPHGVRVYGDKNDRWVKTRPVWDQFHYHVTTFEFENGYWNTPMFEVDNWTTHNNYRQNVQGGAVFPVPDLQVTLKATVVCGQGVHLLAEVRNEGSSGAASGVVVKLYRTDDGIKDAPVLLGSFTTSEVLLPGSWERISFVYSEGTIQEGMEFRALVDEDGVVEECDELNNKDAVTTGDVCNVVY